VVVQVYGILVTIVYDAVVTLIILFAIKAMIGLRVTGDSEREGLDLTQHGEVVQ
jgi:Amt family ammonium transporter